MKVTEYGAIRSPEDLRRLRRAKSAGGASFADMLSAAGETGGAEETAGASDVSATAAVGNMLALQEISEEDVQRRKLVQRGSNMLDTLDNLRRQILTGSIPPHTLRELSRQLSVERQSVSDPGLLSLIDDIELRAAVELAKLEMAIRPGE